MRQLIYRIIYNSFINPILLKVNKALSGIINFRLPPSGTISVNVDPNIHFKMATNQTCYVTFLLYWQGATSFEYTPIFKNLITHCKVFIDVGSNTGYYSLLAAKINSEVEIHGFEPAIGPYHYLRKNVDLNELNGRIKIHQQALSNTHTHVPFFEVRNKKYAYLKYNLGGVGSLETDAAKTYHEIKTETFDNFALKHSFSTIDLIKIDTEGTENLILEGASNAIDLYKPIIICETLFNRIENELERIMKSHNYLFYQFKNEKLVKVNTLVRKVDDGVRDCLFIHPSKLDLIQSMVLNQN